MRHRQKLSEKRSKKLFRKTAKPVVMNKRKKTGQGIKRGGTRL